MNEVPINCKQKNLSFLYNCMYYLRHQIVNLPTVLCQNFANTCQRNSMKFLAFRQTEVQNQIWATFRGIFFSQINSVGTLVSLKNVRIFSEKVVCHCSCKHHVCEGKLLHNKTYRLPHYDPVSNQTALIVTLFRSAS